MHVLRTILSFPVPLYPLFVSSSPGLDEAVEGEEAEEADKDAGAEEGERGLAQGRVLDKVGTVARRQTLAQDGQGNGQGSEQDGSHHTHGPEYRKEARVYRRERSEGWCFLLGDMIVLGDFALMAALADSACTVGLSRREMGLGKRQDWRRRWTGH